MIAITDTTGLSLTAVAATDPKQQIGAAVAPGAGWDELGAPFGLTGLQGATPLGRSR